MDMGLVSSVSEMKAAETSMKVGTAVTKLAMGVAENQLDLVNQLMGQQGIGNNVNTVA